MMFGAEAFLEYFTFSQPTYDYHQFRFTRARDLAAQKTMFDLFDALNPDIRVFQSRGGKLLLFHGWNDPVISPYATINYYQRVMQRLGSEGDRTVRLFMEPGVLHCGGGPGGKPVDYISPLENWWRKVSRHQPFQ